MRLFDTHCHIQSAQFDADRAGVVQRALAELAGVIVVGDTVESSRAATDLVAPCIHAAVGIHPHHAETLDGALAELTGLLDRPGVVAYGEIGLDYYYELAPRPAQRAALTRQLALAAARGLPVIVHCRDAEADMTSVLEEYRGGLHAGGVMHCFSGTPAFAERCLDWGFCISFAGNVTFPKAAALREAAAIVPLDKLLVETDSPYLAPQPTRGKRCEPVFVGHTARALATLMDVPFETFVETTTRNAARLFAINLSEPVE